MSDSEKFAIAARLHVVLRRKLGWVTDVGGMVRDRGYAAEVLRVAAARAGADEEVRDLARRFAAACGSVAEATVAAVFLADVRPLVDGRPPRHVSMPPALADGRGERPAAGPRNPLAGRPVARAVSGPR